jgi:hypothetical protein
MGQQRGPQDVGDDLACCGGCGSTGEGALGDDRVAEWIGMATLYPTTLTVLARPVSLKKSAVLVLR